MRSVVAAILAGGWLAASSLAWIFRRELRTGGWRLHFLRFELSVGRFIGLICLGLLVPSALGTLALAESWRLGPFGPDAFAAGAALLVLAWIALVAQKYFGALPEHLGLRRPRFGPYLQITSHGAVQISWDTPSPEGSRLLWGDSPDSLAEHFAEEGDRPVRHHRVIIREGEAGRSYCYRVPGAGDCVHRFRVPPARDSEERVSFAVVGDPQSAFHVQRAIVDRIALSRPRSDFVVLAGDLVQADNDHAGWRALFDQRSFGGIASEIPLMAAAGNHDGYTLAHLPFGRGRSRFMERFQNVYSYRQQRAGEASEPGHYFSFDYSNVHMCVLDNYESVKSPLLGEAQMAWLRADLAKAEGAWRFVTVHVPVYTLTAHVECRAYVEQLEPIFEEYDVHAVFAGHEHVYQAFFRPRADGEGGMHHFVLGGGGGALEDYSHARWGEARWPGRRIGRDALTPYARRMASSAFFLEGENCHHFMHVVVEGERAEFRTIRSPDGELIGSYEARLRSGGARLSGTGPR